MGLKQSSLKADRYELLAQEDSGRPEGGSSTSSSIAADKPVLEDDIDCLINDPTDEDERLQEATQNETLLAITLEMFLPFLLAGFGMVAAGVVLDTVQHWAVFQEMNQLFILVPALLGLKGNLEMTLASRLSTQSNLGNMDNHRDCWSIVSSNLALIQCQGIVIGFLASIFAAVMDYMTTGKFDWLHSLLTSAASIVTASVASIVLGAVMVVVIVGSRQCKVNPDNVATPIAASLGDLVTLLLLSWISSLLYNDHSNEGWLAPVIIVSYILFVPVCVYVASRNSGTADVLKTGWTPVLVAMSISSLGGLILDKAVSQFKGIAVFQPVFNGVGGNLVAVQASRISTHLHKNSILGVLPKKEEKVCASPINIVIGSNPHSLTCRILLGMSMPGHFLFAFTISSIKAGHTSITPTFFLFYLLAALLQIWILLWVAYWMTMLMWKNSINPDNASIPYLTALGDLLGGALLASTFKLLFLVGDRDADVGDR